MWDPKDLSTEVKGISRIGEAPIYAIDSLVRHAKPLQEIQPFMEGDVAELKIHPKQQQN